MCAVNVGVWAGAGMSAVVVGFAAVGGKLGDIPEWVAGTAQIVRGFSAALGLSRSSAVAVWEQVGSVAVCVAILVVLVWRTELETRRRVATGVVTALALYLGFRQGFVRYDNYHVRQFFAVLSALSFALGGVWALRRILVFTVASFVVLLPGQKPTLDVVLSPVQSVGWAGRTGEFLAVPGRLASDIDRRAASVRDRYMIPSSMLAAVGTDSVTVLPENLEIRVRVPKPGLDSHASAPRLPDVYG